MTTPPTPPTSGTPVPPADDRTTAATAQLRALLPVNEFARKRAYATVLAHLTGGSAS